LSHIQTATTGQAIYVKGVHVQEMQQNAAAFGMRHLITEAGLLRDNILCIPFSRWDLDKVDTYLGDSFTLSAQVLFILFHNRVRL
jgi:hypothetical protein